MELTEIEWNWDWDRETWNAHVESETARLQGIIFACPKCGEWCKKDYIDSFHLCDECLVVLDALMRVPMHRYDD